MSTQQIRALAERYRADELERCIAAELQTGTNGCTGPGDLREIVDELSKAECVRTQVEAGVPLPDAIRDLARRMRAVQRGFA